MLVPVPIIVLVLVLVLVGPHQPPSPQTSRNPSPQVLQGIKDGAEILKRSDASIGPEDTTHIEQTLSATGCGTENREGGDVDDQHDQEAVEKKPEKDRQAAEVPVHVLLLGRGVSCRHLQDSLLLALVKVRVEEAVQSIDVIAEVVKNQISCLWVDLFLDINVWDFDAVADSHGRQGFGTRVAFHPPYDIVDVTPCIC